MKKLFFLIMACICIALTACGKKNAAEPPEERAAALAEAFVNDLNAGRYDKCLENASAAVLAALDANGLAAAWDACYTKTGSFSSVTGVKTQQYQGMYVCDVTAVHKWRQATCRLTYSFESGSGNYTLEGVFFNYSNLPGDEPYTLPEGVVEEDVVLNADGEFPLNAKLTLPEGLGLDDKIPAVALVHGSGPYDMDETVYDSKPFRDIAYYLAQNGIAVLRYDKVTYAYPEKIASEYCSSITVDIETVDDAISAKLLLESDERIDSERIFVLGHSLGGMYAPKICAVGGYAGYISMAGSPRALVDIMYDQNLYFIDRGGYSSAEKEKALALLDDEMQKYNGLTKVSYEEAAEYTIFGVSAYYLKDMMDNPVAPYFSENYPALVLQGARDFQVYFDRDFEWFKYMLEDNRDASFILYDGLNHLFMTSTMESPDINDYKTGGSVDAKVLKDITDWVLKR